MHVRPDGQRRGVTEEIHIDRAAAVHGHAIARDHHPLAAIDPLAQREAP